MSASEPARPSVNPESCPAAHTMLILEAPEARLTKLMRRGPAGLVSQGYNKAYLMRAMPVLITSLEDVAALLGPLATLPSHAIVRGQLTPWGEEERERGRLIRRTLNARPDYPATIHDGDSPILMLDFDAFPASIGEIADDPLGVVELIIAACLPEEFQQATCFYQMSASCGFTRDVAKVHLWFWLSKPRTCMDLKVWFEANAPTTDPAVFNPVQLLYTADAVLEGVSDPLPVRRGWRYGDEDAVSIPRALPAAYRPKPPRQSSEGVRPLGSPQGRIAASLEAVGDGEGQQGFHRPLRAAAMIYARDVTLHDMPRDDDDQLYLMQSAVAAAVCRDGRRERYAAPHYLGELIRTAFEVVGRA